MSELASKVVAGQTPLYYLAAMVSSGIRDWLGSLTMASMRDDSSYATAAVNEFGAILNEWQQKEKLIETVVEDDAFNE
eukprot:3982793-Pyramimonas_sp.AAC.1